MIPDPDLLSVNCKPLRSGQIMQITVCLSKVLLIYLFKRSSCIQKIQKDVWVVFASGIIVKQATEWCDPGEIWLTLCETDTKMMQLSHSMKICHYTQLFNLIIPKQIILVPKQEFSNVLSTHASIIGQLRITVWPLGPQINKERRIFLFHISLTVNTQTGNGS